MSIGTGSILVCKLQRICGQPVILQALSYVAKFALLATILIASINVARSSPVLVCTNSSSDLRLASVLDVKGNTAYYSKNKSRREGVLVTTTDYYSIRFEGSESHFPLEITTNRYVGEFEREFGNELFGQMSSGNVHQTGGLASCWKNRGFRMACFLNCSHRNFQSEYLRLPLRY